MGDVLDRRRALELAATLDLDMNEAGICLACLTFVAFPLDSGDEHRVRGRTLEFTPILWDEGLEQPARRALEQARERGTKDADCALADIENAGPRTTIARAIVRVLAMQMVAEMRARWN